MAAETPAWEFGLRGGMDATGSEEHYAAGEAYLLRELPWRTDLAGGVLASRLDLGAGYLESSGDDGGWLAAGADVVWIVGAGRLEFEAGFRPVYLFDHQYGDDDLGGALQFSSHGGIAFHLSRFTLGYRFQHMSNAGIYDSNPGINLHLFGVGAKF
jgi:hypothetical protein